MPRLCKKRKLLFMDDQSETTDTSGAKIPAETEQESSSSCSFPPRLKWSLHEPDTWNRIFDANMNELATPVFHVEIDKGFKKSAADGGFICQKKNHFQVTVELKMDEEPSYITTKQGLLKVSGLFINMHGVKNEMPNTQVPLGQSLSDRSKRPFEPTAISLRKGEVTKFTIGRLHFCETTANNMRKKGKPNPNQRYFALVVTLTAHANDELHVLASHISDRIIVRASNPALFETESSIHWVRGNTANSIYHSGAIGINTDSPDEALSVHGNIRLTGAIMQPSDRRVKCDLRRVNTQEQLANINKLPIYEYNLHPDWAVHVGRQHDRREYGIIAQELQRVLPEAVKTTDGSIELQGGHRVDNLLLVDKDRVFMENIGAVQELSKVTDRLTLQFAALQRENATLRQSMQMISCQSESLLEGKAHSARDKRKLWSAEPSTTLASWVICFSSLIVVLLLAVMFHLPPVTNQQPTNMPMLNLSQVSCFGAM